MLKNLLKGMKNKVSNVEGPSGIVAWAGSTGVEADWLFGFGIFTVRGLKLI